jgi:hypothetical protein
VSRHDRDVVSLMAGLAVLLLAGAFLVADLTDRAFDGRWVGPGVLLAVGLAGLVASLRSSRTP